MPQQSPSAPHTSEISLAEQRRMVDALGVALEARAAAPVERFETHISFVLVAGDRAYKIRKAVDTGFLDFRTRERRHQDCLEELRLNRRLAPEMYLDVVPVTGTVHAPALGGEPADPLDWALRMRAFAQDGLWDRLAARGELGPAHIDALADLLHDFHRNAAVAPPDSRFGQPVQVRAAMADVLQSLDGWLADGAARGRLQALRSWEQTAFAALRPVFVRRRQGGHVREGHGDLHLGNVVQVDGRTVAFDCLEFSEDLRWIDVMNDIAFMAMDLHLHGRPDLAHRLVNACLERSGDYAGLRVLPYYLVYRALVRAHVAALRIAQQGAIDGTPAPDTAAAVTRAILPYLDFALRTTRPAPPLLTITHGYSGSGKTTFTQRLVESTGAIRIRSDVERKRLFQLEALARSDSPPHAGLYGRDATTATYARLFELATEVLASGHAVVLDATFLRRWQRDAARHFADTAGASFVLLDFEVDAPTLRERIVRRAATGRDASEADLQTLSAQMHEAEPLGEDEAAAVRRCAADDPEPLSGAVGGENPCTFCCTAVFAPH